MHYQREPLITSTLPDYPWQRAATDLFELKVMTFLVLVDYFSRFPEVTQLKSTTSSSVIMQRLEDVFHTLWHTRDVGE